MISTDPWVWLSAILTLCSFTLLYGDNKFFRFAEHTFTAVVIGHAVVLGFFTLRDSWFYPLIVKQNLILIIPIILGILIILIVWRKYAWIASIPMAIMIGVSQGIVLRGLVNTDVMGNVKAVVAETASVLAGTPANQIGTLIRMIFTIAAVFYFMFTFTFKGSSKYLGYVQTFGKYVILIFLGLYIGNQSMQNSMLATSAINRLVRNWLGFG
jgi:hypothetical protein